MSEEEYNVAFVCMMKGRRGVVTWRDWPTEEEFRKWCSSEDGGKYLKNQRVFVAGVSRQRAIALGDATPIIVRIRAALQDVVDSPRPINEETLDSIAQKTEAMIMRSLGRAQ